MTSAQELAKTGPESWGSVLPPVRLTKEQAGIFSALKPAALCLVGSSMPVSTQLLDQLTGHTMKRVGRNRGVWPMRLATTGSHKDTVTANYNKGPFVMIGVQIRLWLDSGRHLKQLAREAGELLARRASECMGTPLLNDFLDLGPDLLMPELKGEIVERARRHGWMCRTDDELVGWLERVRREEQLLDGIGGRR